MTPPSRYQGASLERAIEEIRQAEAISSVARLRTVRSRAMVAQLDRFVVELEEMHMKGGQKVTTAMAGRLQHFLNLLPSKFQRTFPLRTRIAYVLDDLFEIQALMLKLRATGTGAPASDDVEADAAMEF